MDQIGSFIDQGEAHNSWGQWWMMTKYGHFKINGAMALNICAISKNSKSKFLLEIFCCYELLNGSTSSQIYEMKWTLKEKGQ